MRDEISEILRHSGNPIDESNSNIIANRELISISALLKFPINFILSERFAKHPVCD